MNPHNDHPSLTLARLQDLKSHVVPALWAQYPRLGPQSRVKILDVAGPGVVTCIHASMLVGPDSHCQMETTGKDDSAQKVIVRVFYDGETVPAIEMPFMDFLADVDCQSRYFDTTLFSKVKWSHNFRLTMPFRKHIIIELENPYDYMLMGYTDIQWEQTRTLPKDVGYLNVDYRSGTLNSLNPETLFHHKGCGKIVAHWFQYESRKSTRSELAQEPLGEWICEADQQIYLDGDETPTLNYLGSEDAYGFSWGFHEGDGDRLCAILRVEELVPTGARVGALRCRINDAIQFEKSCKWLLTYENDPEAQKVLGDSPIPYKQCTYYYCRAASAAE
jgi:hypothetical protein